MAFKETNGDICWISFSLKPSDRVVATHHGKAGYCNAVRHDNYIIDSVADGIARDCFEKLMHPLADVDAGFTARLSWINLPFKRFASPILKAQ
jgi:hypothetical protein